MSIKSIFTTDENLSHSRGTEWHETTAGTNAGATATKAASAGVRHKVFWISGHTDKDSLIQVKDSTTVIWQSAIDVDVEGIKFHFTFPTPLIGTAGNAVSGIVAESTSDCQVTFGGFSDKSE